MDKEKINTLKAYFAGRGDVRLAYLFGSRAADTAHVLSDWDIALYFNPRTETLEYETGEYYDAEGEIKNDLAKMLQGNVDLVVINHAPATIVFSALRGIELAQKDYLSYSKLLLMSMFDAIDYRAVTRDYFRIAMRSQSINPIDKDRLAKIATFLVNEVRDLERLATMDQITYQQNKDMQRSLDRCVENVANAVIDIAKILASSSHLHLPETYEQLILTLGAVLGFSTGEAEILSKSAGMRNLLAHQYLDLRFRGIIVFVQKTLPSFKYLLSFVQNTLDNEETCKNT